MAIVVRSLAPHEWRTYRAVRLAALRDAPAAFCGTYETAAAYPDQQWVDWCGQPSWFAFDGTDPVGMVRAFPRSGQELPELMSMWVAPRARGTDVAGRLIRAVLDWAALQGEGGVCLGVITDNARAGRLYERHGFVPNGVSAPLPDGRVHIELEHRFGGSAPAPDGDGGRPSTQGAAPAS